MRKRILVEKVASGIILGMSIVKLFYPEAVFGYSGSKIEAVLKESGKSLSDINTYASMIVGGAAVLTSAWMQHLAPLGIGVTTVVVGAGLESAVLAIHPILIP